MSTVGWSSLTRSATTPTTCPAVPPAAPFPGQVLGEMQIPDFRDPSGIVYHPKRGTLFVVGDKGDIAEIRSDGTLVQRRRVRHMDFEGITCDPAGGRLYIAVEGSEKILEMDPEQLRTLRTFSLERQFKGKTVLEASGQGIEGITFVPDSKHPQGGRFILSNQGLREDREEDASALFTVILPLRSDRENSGTIPIERYQRFPMTDLSGLCYDASSRLLLVISDANDRLMLVDSRGHMVAAYVLPGRDQEGVALDKDGILYIAQDSGGIIKCRFERNTSTAPGRTTTTEHSADKH